MRARWWDCRVVRGEYVHSFGPTRRGWCRLRCLPRQKARRLTVRTIVDRSSATFAALGKLTLFFGHIEPDWRIWVSFPTATGAGRQALTTPVTSWVLRPAPLARGHSSGRPRREFSRSVIFLLPTSVKHWISTIMD